MEARLGSVPKGEELPRLDLSHPPSRIRLAGRVGGSQHSPPLLVTKSHLPASLINQSTAPWSLSEIIRREKEVKLLLRSDRQCSCVSPRVLRDRRVVQVCIGGEKLVLRAERKILLASAFYKQR